MTPVAEMTPVAAEVDEVVAEEDEGVADEDQRMKMALLFIIFQE
jgi:hypothetical protein